MPSCGAFRETPSAGGQTTTPRGSASNRGTTRSASQPPSFPSRAIQWLSPFRAVLFALSATAAPFRRRGTHETSSRFEAASFIGRGTALARKIRAGMPPFIREADDLVRCLTIELEIELGLGPAVVPV